MDRLEGCLEIDLKFWFEFHIAVHSPKKEYGYMESLFINVRKSF